MTALSLLVIDKAGRRALLMAAGIGMAATCAVLGELTRAPIVPMVPAVPLHLFVFVSLHVWSEEPGAEARPCGRLLFF